VKHLLHTRSSEFEHDHPQPHIFGAAKSGRVVALLQSALILTTLTDSTTHSPVHCVKADNHM
jgi:hypothetical protein